MRRVSIAEIMAHTGLSRATVDRVLNGRGSVHQRTREVVDEALQRLRAPSSSVIQRPRADMVMRVGRGMSGQLRAAWEEAAPDGSLHDLYQADEAALEAVVAGLCDITDRPLIIIARNSDRLLTMLRDARQKGKRVIAMVSDLDPTARDGFAGIDNRAAGQTAAFLIGRTLGDRPTPVGVVVGDSAFRCHEDREIGFRTCLRGHFPKVVLAGEAYGHDHPADTREAVLKLLREQPALGAIYNVGAGNMGLVDAVKTAGRSEDLLVVCHEVNRITAPLLRDELVHFAIAGDPRAQLAEALRLAMVERPEALRENHHLNFAVYTRFNLPDFSH